MEQVLSLIGQYGYLIILFALMLTAIGRLPIPFYQQRAPRLPEEH